MSNTEVECLQLALKGDQEAFTWVVDTYQRPVYNLCYRMLGNEQEAEDAAQETFWRAWQAIRRYDPQRSFATWLLSIAAHYCIDQQRRRRLPTFSIDLLVEETLPDCTPSPERIVSKTEEDECLHRLLAGMKPEDRAALILRYWYEMPEEEIGRTLSISVSAVKSRLHRARLQMAERWKSTQAQENHSGGICHESPAF